MRRRTVTAAIAVAVYVAMWVGFVHDWAWLRAVDDTMLSRFYDIGTAHPGWVQAWAVFCTVFSPAVFRIVTLVLIVWLALRRLVGAALFLLATVEASGLLTVIAKALADRPRPATALVQEASSSFPSGHALGVMASVLALSTVLLPMAGARWRMPVVVLGAVIVVAIGVGRVVLNVHHPSDVLAGWALGYLWYLLCLPLLSVRVGIPAAPGTSR